MAAYKAVIRWKEFGHSPALQRAVFILADTFAELFVEPADANEVHCVFVQSTKKSLQTKEGKIAVDELSFRVDETAASTAEDAAAITLVLQAQDPALKRFCALFVNTVSGENVDFVGQINSDMSATDIAWSGAEFSNAPNPLREWSCSATTADVAALDTIEMGWLLQQIDSKPQWKYENWGQGGSEVQDRTGFFDVTRDGKNREGRFARLFSFNKLLAEMLNTISTKPLFPFYLTCAAAETDFKVRPGVFDIAEAFNNQGAPIGYNDKGFFAVFGIDANAVYGEVSKETKLYKVTRRDSYGMQVSTLEYLNTHHCLSGGGFETTVRVDNAPDDKEHIWQSAYVLRPEEPGEKTLSYLRYKTFTEFLFAIARSLGMFVRFELDPLSPSDVTIRFISQSSIASATIIEIADASDASLKTQPIQNDSSTTLYSSQATPYSDGGSDYYYWLEEGKRPSKQPSKAGGAPLLFSISPTAVDLFNTDGKAPETYRKAGSLAVVLKPHNMIIYENNTEPDRKDRFNCTEGLHTALYLRQQKSVGWPSQNGGGSGDFWSPVSSLSVEAIDPSIIIPITKTFLRLDDYVNYINKRAANSFFTEYSLTVPYFNRFRKQGETTTSWNTLQVGSRLVLDGVEYSVTTLERDYTTLETKLTISATTRFAFSNPTGSVIPTDLFSLPDANLTVNEDIKVVRLYTPSLESTVVPVRPGDVISILTTYDIVGFPPELVLSPIPYACKTAPVYGDINPSVSYGIAIESANVLEQKFRVVIKGTVNSLRYSGWAKGQTLYVKRYTAPTELNIATTPVPNPNPRAHTNLVIGQADSSNSLTIDFGRPNTFTGWGYDENGNIV